MEEISTRFVFFVSDAIYIIYLVHSKNSKVPLMNSNVFVLKELDFEVRVANINNITYGVLQN